MNAATGTWQLRRVIIRHWAETGLAAGTKQVCIRISIAVHVDGISLTRFFFSVALVL